MTQATATGRDVTRRQLWAWYAYDFGNSAYAAVVLLAVYAVYFKEQVVGGVEGVRLWGIAVGLAMLVVAVTSPILGVIADYSGSKKRFLLFYTLMAVLFTAALFFATPGNVVVGMGCFILAEIGYRSAQVFYNGLLPEIATPAEIGRISGNGWAIGTMGGILCLLNCVTFDCVAAARCDQVRRDSHGALDDGDNGRFLCPFRHPHLPVVARTG